MIYTVTKDGFNKATEGDFGTPSFRYKKGSVYKGQGFKRVIHI